MRISKNLKIIILITCAFLFALGIVLLNFRFRYAASGDTALFLGPKALWHRISTAWDENLNYPLGDQNTSLHIFMPLVFFYQIFSFLPNIIVQYLYFTIVFTSVFLASFYFFQKYLFRNYTASLFASLLYILNLFFFAEFLNYNLHLAFIILPLLFILAQEILKAHYAKIILILIIISCLFPSAFTNPPAILPTLFVASLYFIYLLIKKKGSPKKKILTALSIALALALFLNIWWIYPFIDSMFFNQSVNMQAIKENINHLFETTSLREAFRFSGGWAFNSYYLNFKEGKFDMLYVQNPFFILCTFFPIICAYLTILFKQKRRHIFFFLCLSLLGLTLAKGNLKPLGKIYEYIWMNVPGMFIYREPYTKFMLIYVFAIAALFGYFILHFAKYRKQKKFRTLILILSLLAIIIPSYPFFIGGFSGRYQTGPIKSSLVKVPSYLYDYQRTNVQKMLKYRTLSLPITRTHHYNWEGGFSIGNTALKFFTPQPVLVYRLDDAGGKIVDAAYEALLRKTAGQKQEGEREEEMPTDGKGKAFARFLGLINVREIVQENDLDWRWFNPEITKSPSKMAKILNSLEAEGLIQKKADFGKFDTSYLKKIPNPIPSQWPHDHNLTKEERENLYHALYAELLDRPALALYQINDQFFLPLLYTAQNIKMVDNLDALAPMLEAPEWPMNSVIYLKNQNAGMESIIGDSPDLPDNPFLEFKKINPAKYRLRFHNVRTSFPLVFSSLFHRDWKLYLNNFAPQTINSQDLKNYTITAPNANDQASADELQSLILGGSVSTLGNKEKIDFISKPFNYTIQNNNLPSGKFYETWGKKPVFTQNRLIANGYANSWWIDLEAVKKTGQFQQNPDGSFDVEMILEFWPQRFLTIAVFLSLITLMGCLMYLIKKSVSCYNNRNYAP